MICKLPILSVAALALTLVGCGALTLADFEAKVISIVSASCSFVPTAESIAAIFANANVSLQAPEAIAALICGAVPRPAASAARFMVAQPSTISFPVTIQGQRFTIKGQRN